jgi:type VI protein secretion system component VasK
VTDTEHKRRRSGWLWLWIALFVAAVVILVLWAWPAQRPAGSGPATTSARIAMSGIATLPIAAPGTILLSAPPTARR